MALTLSDSKSPDSRHEEAKVAENLLISPSEDVKSYDNLIRKIAIKLGLPYSELKAPVEDVVFDIVQ